MSPAAVVWVVASSAACVSICAVASKVTRPSTLETLKSTTTALSTTNYHQHLLHSYPTSDPHGCRGQMRLCSLESLLISELCRLYVHLFSLSLASFIQRDVIYTSRAYAMMPVSVCLSICLWRKCINLNIASINVNHYQRQHTRGPEDRPPPPPPPRP